MRRGWQHGDRLCRLPGLCRKGWESGAGWVGVTGRVTDALCFPALNHAGQAMGKHRTSHERSGCQNGLARRDHTGRAGAAPRALGSLKLASKCDRNHGSGKTPRFTPRPRPILAGARDGGQSPHHASPCRTSPRGSDIPTRAPHLPVPAAVPRCDDPHHALASAGSPAAPSGFQEPPW